MCHISAHSELHLGRRQMAPDGDDQMSFNWWFSPLRHVPFEQESAMDKLEGVDEHVSNAMEQTTYQPSTIGGQ